MRNHNTLFFVIDMKTSTTKQLDFWKSEFGNQYTDRNLYNPDSRIPAFKDMLTGLTIKRILEVGCNMGNNLVTLSKLNNFQLIGIEPNSHAAKKGRLQSNLISIIEGDGFHIPFSNSYFDLVFTVGVLIHIAPQDLPKIIDEMYRTSNRYLLIAEYFSEVDTPIEYRGQKDLLFKRNFKKIFLEVKPGLKCIREGFWGKNDGFDDCHWFLFEKPHNRSNVK
ncbi:tRNA (mo5U34)-methyltransferase [Candidatus Bilamarchaeum dharawalense]|uniref:tRNA (Mo5U34)-methyltransferase n=1 Tax=Candidatus Bilamarchaeum dharawalense TaxID=2885759 RepID=A0A5E4LR94_9ARCH|nr:tRNA (mo5U34)-methyltransferase [Candidatus Bilamarchaeum dharawalense]